jgi:hypothetical protein
MSEDMRKGPTPQEYPGSRHAQEAGPTALHLVNTTIRLTGSVQTLRKPPIIEETVSMRKACADRLQPAPHSCVHDALGYMAACTSEQGEPFEMK